MRKLVTFALMLALLLSLSLPVYADVIWEPFEDDFYSKHRDQFSYCGEYAYANSPQGVTQTFEKPGGSKGDTIPNGQLVYIQHSYIDGTGEVWALLNDCVYVPMSDLMNRYDSEFFTDHETQITEQTPEITVEIPGQTMLLTWTYPRGVCTERENYWGEDILSGCSSFYTDEAGLVWGYIGYWYGRQNLWICLSDHNNPDLAQPEIHQGQAHWGEDAPAGSFADAETKPGHPSWLQLALPIGAIVIAGGLLLFWPKKKKA